MEPKTAFRDNGDSDVAGIVVVESDENSVRVVEKRSGDWCLPFWMPTEEFESHTGASHVEHIGSMNDPDFNQITPRNV
jgi:hypothetical protein